MTRSDRRDDGVNRLYNRQEDPNRWYQNRKNVSKVKQVWAAD